MKITNHVCLALLLVAVCQPCDSSADVPGPAASEEGLIQLNFPEDLEIKLLVDYVAKRLGMNILYDESAVKKRITILAPAKVPKDSLLGLLQNILKVTGLALVDADQPGWKQIVESKDLVSLAGRIEEDTARLTTAEPTTAIMQVFPLKHASTQFIQETIKPFLSTPGGDCLAIEDRRLLIVTDYADNLRRAAQVIDLFDRPGPEATIQMVDVKHWEASELAQRVQTLLQDKRRVSGDKAPAVGLTLTHEPRTNRIVVIAAEGAESEAMQLIETLDTPVDTETRTYRFQYVSPGRMDKLARDLTETDARGRYRATVDEEAGLLIVTAPALVHERIETLKRDLDTAVAEELSHVRFYKLMNTSASEVLATIRALEGQEGGLAALGLDELSRSAALKTWDKLGPGPNLPPPLPGPGRQLPEPPVYTPPEKEKGKENTEEKQNQTKGKGQTSQAPTQARNVTRTREAIVSVDTNTNTLIVVAPPPVQQIYKQLIEGLDKRRPQVMIEVTMVTLDTTDNFSLGIEISGSNQRDTQQWLTFSSFGLSTVNPATGALTLIPGLGFNGTLVDPQTADIVLRALATEAQAKVLSAPRILVNDNATGTLSSVAESPFTSTNAMDTIATTSFGGYASAGTTVAVTPHISEDDYLRLIYSLTLNSFTGQAGVGIPPPRQTNSIDSEVVVPDGYTVIVGGLKRHDTSETVTKLPLLGDIPILGHLFRSTTLTDIETSLFVFMRPVILRDDEFLDLKHLSDWDLRKAEMPAETPASRPMLMR
jgi:general secretion pathway protein D